MSHSVGYSRVAELGRVQRRDLYFFLISPQTYLLTNTEIMTETVTSKLPVCWRKESKVFHVL